MHTWETREIPFPQGYIITWIIKSGQPEKEEGNSSEFQEDLWLNRTGFEKFLLHRMTQTESEENVAFKWNRIDPFSFV